MKKIFAGILIVTLFLCSCNKDSKTCYSCHVYANGDDTIICDKSKAQLDALQNNLLQGGCVKNP